MSTQDAPFQPGSLVFEPFLGLCQIICSMQETMLGTEQLFYQLRPRQGNAVIKVPAAQMSTRGIRPLLSEDQVQLHLCSELASPESDLSENYAQRLRRWTQMVRSKQESGSYAFLREWSHLSAQGTRFSLQETEMREKIQRSLTQEIAEVLQISSGRATVKLNQWLVPAKATKEKKK